MDDDKEKLVIDELVDTVKGAVGDAAKAAVMPSTDPKAEPDPEGVAEKANEQVYLGGDAAVAPEAVPAPAPPVPKKKAKKTPVKIAHAKIPPAPKWRHLQVEGLSRRRSCAPEDHDARHQRVHSPLPDPYSAARLPSHPPLRSVRS
jgi:hypothetical protein